MIRQFIHGGWYGDHLPSGAWCVLIPHSHIQTHLGIVPFPVGEAFGPLYLRCTEIGGFRFAGQAHDTNDPACWERHGSSWVPYAPPCFGVSPVIYDHDGVLHRSDGSVGSQGYRYVTPQNQLISGDATYGPWNGLSEYTDLGDSLWIGQGHDAGTDPAVVWDGAVLRLLEVGPCRFIRANRAGETVALAFTRPDGVVLILTSMAELRALPPVVSLPAPEPPSEPPPVPVPPTPPQPAPVPPVPPSPQPPKEPMPKTKDEVRAVIQRIFNFYTSDEGLQRREPPIDYPGPDPAFWDWVALGLSQSPEEVERQIRNHAGGEWQRKHPNVDPQ